MSTKRLPNKTGGLFLFKGSKMNKINLVNGIALGMIVLMYASMSFSADNTTIVDSAVTQIKTFLLGDARRVIDLGLLGGGAAASLLRGSWTPVMGGGIAMAVYEILVNVVK